jgi:hypothetical protein
LPIFLVRAVERKDIYAVDFKGPVILGRRFDKFQREVFFKNDHVDYNMPNQRCLTQRGKLLCLTCPQAKLAPHRQKLVPLPRTLAFCPKTVL